MIHRSTKPDVNYSTRRRALLEKAAKAGQQADASKDTSDPTRRDRSQAIDVARDTSRSAATATLALSRLEQEMSDLRDWGHERRERVAKAMESTLSDAEYESLVSEEQRIDALRGRISHLQNTASQTSPTIVARCRQLESHLTDIVEYCTSSGVCLGDPIESTDTAALAHGADFDSNKVDTSNSADGDE